MKNVIKLLTPHQFCKILFRITYTHFHKLDHLGDVGGFIQHIADRDIYEYVSGDDKLRLRIIKEDRNYHNLYALKAFQKAMIEYYSQGTILLELHELVREMTTLGYTKNPAPYRFMPECLKLNSDGTSTTASESISAYGDFFLFHYHVRNNGIIFQSKEDIDKWLSERGLKTRHETRGIKYLSNPWNDSMNVVIGERMGEYPLSIYEPTGKVGYYGGNEFADLFIYWLTNEYRCR